MVGNGGIRRAHYLLKSARKCGDGIKTVFRLLLQRAQDHAIDSWRDGRIERARRVWWGIKMLIHHLLQTTLKRGTTGKEFVDHDGKRILISCSDCLAFPLFRSHIGRRAANSTTHARDRGIEFRYAKISQQ